MDLNQYSQSAAQPGLAVDFIKNLLVPIPPLPEQTAIASYLNHATTRIDALREKIDKQVALLKEYRTSLITAAVIGQIDVRGYQKKSKAA
jgi:type I restriction enzyme S subunit